MGIITLITTVLELAIKVFGFLSKRSADNEAMKKLMEAFAQKHNEQVQKNLKLREEYEKLKKKLEGKSDVDSQN